MSEEFDMEKYRKSRDKFLKKLANVTEHIQEERAKEKTTEELIEETKKVNKYFNELNVETKIIANKKSDEE